MSDMRIPGKVVPMRAIPREARTLMPRVGIGDGVTADGRRFDLGMSPTTGELVLDVEQDLIVIDAGDLALAMLAALDEQVTDADRARLAKSEKATPAEADEDDLPPKDDVIRYEKEPGLEEEVLRVLRERGLVVREDDDAFWAKEEDHEAAYRPMMNRINHMAYLAKKIQE